MFGVINLRPCQHDDGYIDGRSLIKVRTDERTQVHSARFSLTVTDPSTNQRIKQTYSCPQLIGITANTGRHNRKLVIQDGAL